MKSRTTGAFQCALNIVLLNSIFAFDAIKGRNLFQIKLLVWGHFYCFKKNGFMLKITSGSVIYYYGLGMTKAF